MKLAIVTNAFTYNRLNLFERLARDRNHHITIYKYADWWDAESNYLEIKKWKAIGFNIPFLIDNVYFHFDPRVFWEIAHTKSDVLIAYGYGSLTTWGVALLAKLFNITFVIWSDSRLEYELKRSPITLWAKSLLHRFSEHFIASSTSSQMFLEHMGIPKDNITVAPYAINNIDFFMKFKKWKCLSAEIRSELNIPNKSVVILYVGRMVKEKGINELITSFSNMPNKSKLSLVLVGDGNDRTEFEEMVKNLELTNVIFTGYVPHAKIAKYYAIGDIFVLPSYKDVWGLVVNEAMVCGLPIVTTHEVGAWRDLVQSKKNGFVIKSRDADALTAVLIDLCNDQNLRRSMGQYSHQLIQQWDIHHALKSVGFVLKKVKK
jgi:glycosyltransferase involved in cell wall biosynthesis